MRRNNTCVHGISIKAKHLDCERCRQLTTERYGEDEPTHLFFTEDDPPQFHFVLTIKGCRDCPYYLVLKDTCGIRSFYCNHPSYKSYKSLEDYPHQDKDLREYDFHKYTYKSARIPFWCKELKKHS